MAHCLDMHCLGIVSKKAFNTCTHNLHIDDNFIIYCWDITNITKTPTDRKSDHLRFTLNSIQTSSHNPQMTFLQQKSTPIVWVPTHRCLAYGNIAIDTQPYGLGFQL